MANQPSMRGNAAKPKARTATRTGRAAKRESPAAETVGLSVLPPTRTARQARARAADSAALRKAGLTKTEIAEQQRFAAFSRLFPQPVAAILSKQATSSPADIAKLEDAEFADLLAGNGVAAPLVDLQRQRLGRIRAATRGGPVSATLDGILIDVAPGALSSDDLEILRAHDIATLDEWSLERATIEVSDKGRATLDSYAGLRAAGIATDNIRGLIRAGVDNPYRLAFLDAGDTAALARKANVKPADIEAWSRGARRAMARSAMTFANTIAYAPGSLTGIGIGAATDRPCRCCPEDWSAFSQFAYVNDLVRLSGDSIADLDARLHQDFAGLRLSNAYRPVAQAALCATVLSRAFPVALNHAQRFPAQWQLVRGAMAIASLGADQLADAAASVGSGIGATDLATRLSTYLPLPAAPPATAFSTAEIDAIGLALDGLALLPLRDEVAREPAFRGQPSADIVAEASRRLAERMEPHRQAAAALRRDAYKVRAGLGDEELEQRLCIEMSAGACEMTTRVGQAIHSLQAMLDQRRAAAWVTGERARWAYDPYDVWRAKRLATTYPEFAAIARGDVLTGDDGAPTRGSILRGGAAARADLRSAVARVRLALRDARIAPDRNYSNASPFAGTEFEIYFERGLETISRIVDADEACARASAHLDNDEPGLALAALADAQSSLDAMARVVFREDALWRDPAQSSFEALLKLSPPWRRGREVLIANDILINPKALYEANPALAPITGLDIATGRFNDLSRWSVGRGTRLADQADGPSRSGRLIKSRLDPYDNSSCETTYIDGQHLADYMVSCDVDLTWASGFHGESEFEIFGLVARTDARARYRLVVMTDWITETSGTTRSEVDTENDTFDALANTLLGLIPHDDEITTVSVLRAFLVLQRVDAGGNVSELARNAEGVALVEGRYAFTFTAKGRQLTGALVMPGGGRREVSVGNAGQPPGSHGSFGIVASASVEADFGPLMIEVTRAGDDMYPPFFAARRASPEARHRVDPVLYNDHRLERRPLGIEFDPQDLFRIAEGGDAQALANVRRSGAPLNLLFEDGQTVVSTDALDALLDKLLSMTFHLAYGVIPTRMSEAYARTGDYERAANLLRLLYDDGIAGEYNRTVCPYFDAPPAAAAPTVGFDARLYRFRLGEIYLSWADWLFRKDDPETRHAARLLLERVLALHGEPASCDCDRAYRDVPGILTQAIGLAVRAGSADAVTLAAIESLVARVLVALSAARSAGVESTAIAGIFAAFSTTPPQTADQALALLRQAEAALTAACAPPDVALTAADRAAFSGSLADLLNRGAGLPGHPVDRLPRRDGLVPVGDWVTSHGLQGTAATDLLASWLTGLCVPENPLLARQKRRACILLDHLANCRNILGYPEDFVPERRFAFLLQTARQLGELALAAEKDLLSYRQNFEQESFSLLQAVNQLAAAEATANIERLKADNALAEIGQAQLQVGQAQFSVQHYDTLLANGLSLWEGVALGAAWTSAGLSTLSVLPAVAGVALAAVGVGAAATGIGSVPGAAMATVGAAGSLLSAVTGGISGGAQAAGAISGAAAMTASFERRAEDWRYQRGLALHSAAIAEGMVRQAIGRHLVALAERDLADLGRHSAADVVQFLSAKFMNREMWAWMQRTIREEYRRRLNYAINAAFIAERALAFEQQHAVDIVRFDYFDPRRDGLLGANQLMTDLAALEVTRQQQEVRKLQMSKNISLASAMPADFQMFREGTGRLPFRTLLRWFDEDFPGHYLRLIRGVRVTVVALLPPLDGIHATLTNGGLSRVVLGPPFAETTIRAMPEQAAYSSAYQATGVFQLEYQGEYRMPFEGSGVEVDWVLELPRAANAFDFRTIADVILTIDYTALADAGLRRRKQLELGGTRSGERALSLKFNYPDIWYQLHNPQGFATPMVVEFDVRPSDFPANIAAPVNDHVMLYLSRRDGATFEVAGLVLEYDYVDATGAPQSVAAAAATTSGGVLATRRPIPGGGHPWDVFKGKPALGRWRMHLPDTAAMRALFAQGDIVDAAFVISYTGTVPGWPA